MDNKLDDMVFNLKDMRRLNCIEALEEKDLRTVESSFTTVGLSIDVNSVKKILHKKKQSYLHNNESAFKDKIIYSEYGDVIRVTNTIGRFFNKHPEILKEFYTHNFQNEYTMSIKNYMLYRSLKIVPKNFLNKKNINFPSYFKDEWKNEFRLEEVERGKIVPIIKDKSKAQTLKTYILKWIYACGIPKDTIDYDSELNVKNVAPHTTIDTQIQYNQSEYIISNETLSSIFNFCNRMYKKYLELPKGNIDTLNIKLTYNIKVGNLDNPVFEKEFDSLQSTYYFELLTYKTHQDNVLKFCKCCKEFYWGSSKKKACSNRCRDLLSGKYEKRKEPEKYD